MEEGLVFQTIFYREEFERWKISTEQRLTYCAAKQGRSKPLRSLGQRMTETQCVRLITLLSFVFAKLITWTQRQFPVIQQCLVAYVTGFVPN